MIENIAPKRLIAVVRTRDPELAVPLAEAIVRGGVSTGGVDLSNATDFLRAGAAALGVGSALTSGVEPGLEGVSARTRSLKQLVSKGRLEVSR